MIFVPLDTFSRL